MSAATEPSTTGDTVLELDVASQVELVGDIPVPVVSIHRLLSGLPASRRRAFLQ